MNIEELVIKLSLDGDQWCALVGENLQEGMAGFGNSPLQALNDLIDQFRFEPYNVGSITIGPDESLIARSQP